MKAGLSKLTNRVQAWGSFTSLSPLSPYPCPDPPQSLRRSAESLLCPRYSLTHTHAHTPTPVSHFSLFTFNLWRGWDGVNLSELETNINYCPGQFSLRHSELSACEMKLPHFTWCTSTDRIFIKFNRCLFRLLRKHNVVWGIITLLWHLIHYLSLNFFLLLNNSHFDWKWTLY